MTPADLGPWGLPAVLIVTLGVYRVVRFLVWDSLMGMNPESGTWWATKVDGFAYNDDGTDRSWLRGKIGDLLTCPWCMGAHVTWITLWIWTDIYPWDFGRQGWILVLAMAGAAGFLDSLTD